VKRRKERYVLEDRGFGMLHATCAATAALKDGLDGPGEALDRVEGILRRWMNEKGAVVKRRRERRLRRKRASRWKKERVRERER